MLPLHGLGALVVVALHAQLLATSIHLQQVDGHEDKTHEYDAELDAGIDQYRDGVV